MQSLIKWYVNEGQKRNARLVSEEDSGKGAATRINHQSRKRGKNGSSGLNHG